MSNIVVRFNKPILVKERKRQVQQIDELLPGPAFLTHAYKWLGPVHDMINMADSKTKGIFKNFFEWYQDNDTVQTVGQDERNVGVRGNRKIASNCDAVLDGVGRCYRRVSITYCW